MKSLWNHFRKGNNFLLPAKWLLTNRRLSELVLSILMHTKLGLEVYRWWQIKKELRLLETLTYATCHLFTNACSWAKFYMIKNKKYLKNDTCKIVDCIQYRFWKIIISIEYYIKQCNTKSLHRCIIHTCNIKFVNKYNTNMKIKVKHHTCSHIYKSQL